eukprot:6173922-Pleurochrysis_carterae.AAC.2
MERRAVLSAGCSAPDCPAGAENRQWPSERAKTVNLRLKLTDVVYQNRYWCVHECHSLCGRVCLYGSGGRRGIWAALPCVAQLPRLVPSMHFRNI